MGRDTSTLRACLEVPGSGSRRALGGSREESCIRPLLDIFTLKLISSSFIEDAVL